MAKSTGPTLPLRATPEVLAEWDKAVEVARRHLAEHRQIPTATLKLMTLLAMDQEIKILRSQNDALRMFKGQWEITESDG